jgi:hypothetical protein
VLGQTDSDGDGVPDNVEATLGFDPNNPDTNGNGSRRRRGHGSRSAADELELVLWPRSRIADSDGNGINDDLEDGDNDGLVNFAEQQNSANPTSPDSDGDGWDDNGEVADGADPADPNSTPPVAVRSPLVSFLNAVAQTPPAGTPLQVLSLPASYLNATATSVPQGTPISVASPLASYQRPRWRLTGTPLDRSRAGELFIATRRTAAVLVPSPSSATNQ